MGALMSGIYLLASVVAKKKINAHSEHVVCRKAAVFIKLIKYSHKGIDNNTICICGTISKICI